MFSSREADRLSGATLLNLENNQVRGLALNLPQITAGQPLPCVVLHVWRTLPEQAHADLDKPDGL